MTLPASIQYQRRGATAFVTLDRPKALNSLDYGMCLGLVAALGHAVADPSIATIVLQGAGGRAFCAGGDVRAMQALGPGPLTPDDPRDRFFAAEYRLVGALHRATKPVVTLMNGITMGAGAGVAMSGRFRVATEATLFAMPETAIGLTPDVGATRFLGGLPGFAGRYLGMSGARLKAADLVFLGLATHYVPLERMGDLIDALDGGIEPALAAVVADPGPAPINALRPAIDRCFGERSVEAILAALEAEGTAWAAETLAALRRASPTSLAIAFRQLTPGQDLDIESAIDLEYLLCRHLLARPDFYEGVRAMLVDKDQKPRWQPPIPGGVTEVELERCFAPADAQTPSLFA
jgi:enoyl-CoA hydratase